MEFVEHNQAELRDLEEKREVVYGIYTEKLNEAEQARKELIQIESRIRAVKETIEVYSQSDPFHYRNVLVAPLEIK